VQNKCAFEGLATIFLRVGAFHLSVDSMTCSGSIFGILLPDVAISAMT